MTFGGWIITVIIFISLSGYMPPTDPDETMMGEKYQLSWAIRTPSAVTALVKRAWAVLVKTCLWKHNKTSGSGIDVFLGRACSCALNGLFCMCGCLETQNFAARLHLQHTYTLCHTSMTNGDLCPSGWAIDLAPVVPPGASSSRLPGVVQRCSSSGPCLGVCFSACVLL